jgi:hypothetical protein
MLQNLLGGMSVFPAVTAYRMASRQLTYAKGNLPPNKTYMLMTLVHHWMLLLAYWMLGMLVFYGVFLTLMLTVQKIDPGLFAFVFDAVLIPWRSANVLSHAVICLAPVAVAAVALVVQPTRNRTTRAYVVGDLRYVLMLMALTAGVTFLLWLACLQS